MIIFKKLIHNFIKIIRKIFNNTLKNESSTSKILIGKNSKIFPARRVDGEQYIVIGDNTTIMPDAWLSAYDKYWNFTYKPSINIGNSVYIGSRACITGINKITIGDYCVISEDVYISDHMHGVNPENGPIARQALISKGEVNVGENTFLGFRVSVLPGVSLGKNCVVGAHSVVTHSFPDYSMIAGIPARLIKRYSFEIHEWVNVIDEE